jgi:dienelactone hydrolase
MPIWRPLFVLLLALCLASPALAREAPQDTDLGRVVKGEHGTYYFPKGAKGHEAWPVLIVEKGLANDQGKLWPLLVKKLKVIVVETVSQRSLANARDGGRKLETLVDAALQEASNYHWRLNRTAWIPVGFSAMGTSTAQMVFRNPGRFHGLLLLNSNCGETDLPSDLSAFENLPVGILHCRGDEVVPHARAEAVSSRLEKAGLDVGFGLLEGDRMAPVREKGAEYLAAILRVTEDRLRKEALPPRWFEDRTEVGRRRIEGTAADGRKFTGDLYETGKKDAPIVLLFHQARSGRGEYRLIAPRLVKAGFNCLAIDQRVGDGWGGLRNETAAAYGGKRPLQYGDAKPDLYGAVSYVRGLHWTGKLAVVGSSYSAALAVLLAAESVHATSVVLFSPGDYLKPRGLVLSAAQAVGEPTLVIAPKNEEMQARMVFTALSSPDKDLVVLPKGVHGASTLYRSPDAEKAWKSFLAFLHGTLR